MATRLLPDPVGVLRMTLAPETSSMTASSCAGYSARPRSPAQWEKASNSSSSSAIEVSRSVSAVIAGEL